MYSMERQQYPSDVSDDEWAFAAPYLTLMSEEAPNVITPCAKSLTACATSYVPAQPGA